MTEELLIKTIVEVKSASSKRPTSLITRIPPTIRDILGIKKDDPLIWEVYSNNGEKYIKIRKQI